MRRKIQRARGRCIGAQTTIARVIRRSTRSGTVCDAFCAVVAAASSRTSSTSGPRQRLRISLASPNHPLKTTVSARAARAMRSAAATIRRWTRAMLVPSTTTAGALTPPGYDDTPGSPLLDEREHAEHRQVHGDDDDAD